MNVKEQFLLCCTLQLILADKVWPENNFSTGCWPKYSLLITVCRHLPPPHSLLQSVISLDDMNATNCQRMRRVGWGHGVTPGRGSVLDQYNCAVLGIMTLLCEETKQFTSFSFQTLAVISPLLATRHPPAAACCMNESERIHILWVCSQGSSFSLNKITNVWLCSR